MEKERSEREKEILERRRKEKGGKVKEERKGRINLVPEGKWKIYGREIGGRKGKYQDRDCQLYLPPMLITARLLYLLFNVNCRRTFNAPIY